MPVSSKEKVPAPVHVPAKQKSTAGYKAAIIVLVLILLALGAYAFMGTPGNVSGAQQNVVDIFRVITGQNVTIINTTEMHGVYRMTVMFKDTTGNNVVQDIFVTKDGLFSTDRLIDLQAQKSLLISQSAFANCLTDKKVTVIGLQTDQNTQLQLQLLGAFAGRVYFDCSGQNQQVCAAANITKVPMILINGTFYQGPQNLQFFEQATGCSMATNVTQA